MLRLDRMLVTLGKGSRSEMQKAIRGGRVRVNGDVQRDPSAQVAEDAEILLNGEKLDTRLTRHVMLHKPAGLLTAARDKKQPTVMDLLPPEYAAIGCMPVGRLDKDTTGLLLLTTDGELNHRLLAPARHVDKTYLATLDKPVGEKEVAVFASGLSLSDFEAAPADLTPLPDNPRGEIPSGEAHVRGGRARSAGAAPGDIRLIGAGRGASLRAVARTDGSGSIRPLPGRADGGKAWLNSILPLTRPANQSRCRVRLCIAGMG